MATAVATTGPGKSCRSPKTRPAGMAIVQYDLIRTIMAENLLQPIQEAKAERLAGIQSMFEDMGKFRMQ